MASKRQASVSDIARGLWLWSAPHPDWRDNIEWGPMVNSFVADIADRRIAIDPTWGERVPEEAIWRLDSAPPSDVLVLKREHLRGAVDMAVRYGANLYAPLETLNILREASGVDSIDTTKVRAL